jgi:2-oxo-4-hydroxy-4-carboxy--5-ureidoimidazoline (OHCU) decarboxylase
MKQFLMKQMLKRQMKSMPADQQEKMMKLVEENPDLFMKIAQEVQDEMKSGKDQMSASMVVMGRHKEELQRIFSK